MGSRIWTPRTHINAGGCGGLPVILALWDRVRDPHSSWLLKLAVSVSSGVNGETSPTLLKVKGDWGQVPASTPAYHMQAHSHVHAYPYMCACTYANMQRHIWSFRFQLKSFAQMFRFIPLNQGAFWCNSPQWVQCWPCCQTTLLHVSQLLNNVSFSLPLPC